MKKMYLGLGRKIFLQIFTLLCVSLYQVQVWNCWWWDCRGLHEERSGLPHARHSQFLSVPSSSILLQPVPAGPTSPAAGHSWAQQPCWWFLRENTFKKGQNATWWDEEKKCENKSRVFLLPVLTSTHELFFIPFSPLVLPRGECGGESGWVGLGTWYFCQG